MIDHIVVAAMQSLILIKKIRQKRLGHIILFYRHFEDYFVFIQQQLIVSEFRVGFFTSNKKEIYQYTFIRKHVRR